MTSQELKIVAYISFIKTMSKNGSVPPAQTAKTKGSKTILFLE